LGNQAGKSFKIKMDKKKNLTKLKKQTFLVVWVKNLKYMSNEMLNSERTPTLADIFCDKQLSHLIVEFTFQQKKIKYLSTLSLTAWSTTLEAATADNVKNFRITSMHI
jgi:hypothetical protein